MVEDVSIDKGFVPSYCRCSLAFKMSDGVSPSRLGFWSLVVILGVDRLSFRVCFVCVLLPSIVWNQRSFPSGYLPGIVYKALL